MEKLSTPQRPHNLTDELNHLANTDNAKLRQRICELLQSNDPEAIAEFEVTQSDPKLNLLITDVISSCELELNIQASRHHGTTREGVLNLFDAIAGAGLSDDDNAGSEGEDI